MNRVVMSALGLGALFVFMVGCNDGVANAPCNVSGNVTYKGAPVTGGNMTFWCKEGEAIPPLLMPPANIPLPIFPLGRPW